jgi:uncharacterized protein (TIGR02594 family)
MTTDELKTRIAQTHLKEIGLYTAEVDGDWGPKSRAAATEWWKDRIVETAAGKTPYEMAREYLGTEEIPGAQDNPLIVGWLQQIASWVQDDETAWCSAFVDAMARATGYEHTGKLNARSWLEVGEVVNLKDARPGDVVIFWRNSPTSWEGHVAFFVSQGDTHVRVLGGNQNNSVSEASYPKTKVIGVRRMKKVRA